MTRKTKREADVDTLLAKVTTRTASQQARLKNSDQRAASHRTEPGVKRN